MIDALLDGLPRRHGHFVLESGLHTDTWLSLDALFVDPTRVAPAVAALADSFRSFAPAAICGPLVGGAFVAQAVATRMGVDFHYTERECGARDGLFSARYRLSAAARLRAAGQRVAVVDDVISAGSAIRATIDAVRASGATVVAVGALLLLGRQAVAHLDAEGLPGTFIARRSLQTWTPDDCPYCRDRQRLDDPADVPVSS